MSRDELAPILLFVYNRPIHTYKTMVALEKNRLASVSNLYIYSDGFKDDSNIDDVNAVREVIKRNYEFKQIILIERETNLGLARNIISGVTEQINRYKRVIVLEDDLITSFSFLEYMNSGLEYYKENPQIWSISAYSPPIHINENYKLDLFLGYRANSWGWSTWHDRWMKCDWSVSEYTSFIRNPIKRIKFNRGGRDMTNMLVRQMHGEIDSWAIRWCFSQFLDGSLCLYPVKSKILNIGLDGSGSHCGVSKKYDVELNDEDIEFTDELKINRKISKNFKNIFWSRKHYIKVVIIKIFKILKIYQLMRRCLSLK